MCRGREEDRSHGNPSLCINFSKEDDQIQSQSPLSCELCSSKATLYCQADDAFLCQKCDRRVHGANFLAQRHVRCLLCGACNRLTRRFLVGASAGVVLPAVAVRLRNYNIQGSQSSNLEDVESDDKVVKEPFLFL